MHRETMEESCEQVEQVNEHQLEAANNQTEEKIHAEQREEEEKDAEKESESEPEDPAAMEIQMEYGMVAEQTAAVCSSAVAVPVDFVPEVEKADVVEKSEEVENVEEAEEDKVNAEERLVESPVAAVMDPEPVPASCDGSELEATTLGSLLPSKELMEEIVDSAAASGGSSLEVGDEVVDEVAAVTSEPTMGGAAEHDPLASEQQADDDDSSSAKPLIA